MKIKLNKILEDFAKRKGIIAGICDAEPLINIESLLAETDTPFVSKNIKKRIDPKISLKNAKSVIVIGVNYNKKYDFVCDDELRGIISIYAAQEDYHITLRHLLDELVLDIKQSIGNFNYKILADSGSLVEKELAIKTGLGFYGKNSLVISERFGSLFFIGCLLTDIEVDLDEISRPILKDCESCNKCVKACPTNAIDNGKLDSDKCISYLTQKRGDLSIQESNLIGNWLYGCDICQAACPHNKQTPAKSIKSVDQAMPKISEIMNISDEEFTLRFGNTVINWAGKETIMRNAKHIY